MFSHPFSRYAGLAAFVAGCLGVFAAVCLSLFFAVETRLGTESPFPFGFLSDVLPIYAAPLAIGVCILIFQVQRQSAPQWSTAAAFLGIAGNLILGTAHILYVMERITLDEQIAGYFLSLGLLGLWHILVNRIARRDGTLPARLAGFGILVGVSQVLSFVLLFVLSGYNLILAADFGAITANIPLFIFMVFAYPISLLGYIGPSIWLLWLGQDLMRSDRYAALRTGFNSGAE